MFDITLPLFSLQPETKEIPLSKGKVTIVDATDYEWLMQWKWQARKRSDGRGWYASRQGQVNGKRNTILMHRVLTKVPADAMVDHKDGDGLNNTRVNLRHATNAQNQYNAKRRSDNKSGYKGVYLRSPERWEARIKGNGKTYYLGTFDSPLAAALAYDAAAIKMHGRFCATNFKESVP